MARKLTQGQLNEMRLRHEHNSQAGRGVQVRSLPADEFLEINDFRGGLSMMDNDGEQIPQSQSAEFVNVMITKDDKVRPIGGLRPFYQAAPGISIRSVFVFPGANTTSKENLVFTPAEFGIQSVDDGPITFHPLPTASFFFPKLALYGDTLLLAGGNNDNLYYKALGATAFSNAGAWGGDATSLTVWAGRVWAAATKIGGVYNSRGIKWTGSNDFNDFAGYDSGEEILLDFNAQQDPIQALVPMGQQQMAIILRRSIWVAQFSGDALRPGAFQFVSEGIGAVRPDAVTATPFGTAFISDNGVYIFDGSALKHISAQVDAEITQGLDVQCSCTYDHMSQQLFVFMTSGTYVYDFKFERWIKISSVFNNGATVSRVIDDGWFSHLVVWAGENAYYLGVDANGTLPGDKYFVTKQYSLGDSRRQILLKGFDLEYSGDPLMGGMVALAMVNQNTEYTSVGNMFTFQGPGDFTEYLDTNRVGDRVRFKLTFTTGKPAIKKLTVKYQRRGRAK